jgi:membrane protease YdiL (CAAX protease family)
MIGVLGVFALIILVGAVGEEVGWRGFALPQLQRRFSPLVATAILAPLWWAWHLPQFFVLQTYRDFTPIEYLGMLFGLSCGTWVLTWLFNGSGGSLLAVVVWHGVYNCASATQASTGVVAAAVTTVVMAQAAVLLVLRRRVPAAGGG